MYFSVDNLLFKDIILYPLFGVLSPGPDQLIILIGMYVPGRYRINTYIMGAPHRLRYLRETLEHIRARPGVLFWTGEQILEWYQRS